MSFEFESYFSLSKQQYHVLLVIQKELIVNDIERTTDLERKQIKKKWLYEWQNSITDAINQTEFPSFTKELLRKKMSALKSETRDLILLEAIAFVPYFMITERGSGTTHGLEKLNEGFRIGWVMELKDILPKYEEDISEITQTFSHAIREVVGSDWSNYKRNKSVLAIIGATVVLGITGGAAAPLIGGMIGTSILGLTGAAATSAGLALLGGGSLAVGGLGMAGGTAIIAGSSAILGGIIGSNLDNRSDLLISFDSNYLISFCSKTVTIIHRSIPEDERSDLIAKIAKQNKTNIDDLKELESTSEIEIKKKLAKLMKIDPKEMAKVSGASLKNVIKRNISILENTNKVLGKISTYQHWYSEEK